MRKYTEPSVRNLLRKPLVLGVPFNGLLVLTFATLGVFVLFGANPIGNAVSAAIAVLGYAGLWGFQKIARPGWDEVLTYRLVRLIGKKSAAPEEKEGPRWTVSMPDTLTESDLLRLKDDVLERISGLKAGKRLNLRLSVASDGAELTEFTACNVAASDLPHTYSLHCLPVVTDPLWLFGIVRSLPRPSQVIVSIQGVDGIKVRRQIEHSRRSSAVGNETLRDIDAAVTFEETSSVLLGLSRGDEAVVELSMTILTHTPAELDPSLFAKDAGLSAELARASATGQQPGLFRAHLVRAVTASDLVPNIADPKEHGAAILKTRRGTPLYFSPQDPRLEALHWLVVGASGSGKSFFTGLVLKRMLEQGSPMSVLFVDHGRSFKRLVKSMGAPYLEPRVEREMERGAVDLFSHWNKPGTFSGIELSGLPLSQRAMGVQTLLLRLDTFLKLRDSTHPVYLVLDECWSLMREHPALVQLAFREFRKLNGGVIAITQSLQDFVSDESGQSIFQNAPVRVLLRQGEDIGRYQGILGLNPVETQHLSRLSQKRGEYSECLIKTPYLSRLGRLYPTPEEHALLRTDNLREELVAETRAARRTPIVLGSPV